MTRDEFKKALLSLETDDCWNHSAIEDIFSEKYHQQTLEEYWDKHGENYWICCVEGYNPVALSFVCDTFATFFYFMPMSGWQEESYSFKDFLDSILVTMSGDVVVNGTPYNSFHLVRMIKQAKKEAAEAIENPVTPTLVEKQPWVL